MFLLNVYSVRHVGFGFSNVTFWPSRVFHFRVFSYPSVHTDEQNTWSCPHFYHTFKMLWQIFRADNVFVRCQGLFRYFISSYYSTRCWIFHCTIRFINQISKGVPYETFSMRYHFHKIVHENSFALTLPCFIWVSRAIAKHIVLTAFCQCSSFVVNDITEI